jgi:hypothetical protein
VNWVVALAMAGRTERDCEVLAAALVVVPLLAAVVTVGIYAAVIALVAQTLLAHSNTAP